MADKVLRSLTFPGLSDRYTIPDGLSAEAKEALLDCFEHVAWTDDQGQTYYDALYDALYPRTLTGIVASFNQTGITIYDTDTLDTLKQYLTVTAYYSDATSEAVTNYTLSGTLAAGTSTITASYGGFLDTFSVTVTHVAGTYTVTNTLTGCTSSNSATYATEGASYSATISASSGYTLTGATVSITMGGVDITSTAYSNGTISIASVTGALAITVTAVAVTLSSISAVYTQSGTVYDTDTLDSLKSDLVVTAAYSDSTTETVPAADYTLSGTLTEGSSTITVSYGGKTTTFTVTVTAAPGYVTAGLIAYWDGIDNTGNGHDSSATTWKDLVGNYDLTKQGASGTSSWDDDALVLTGNSVQGYSGSSIWTRPTNATIEIVLKPTASITQMVGTFDRSDNKITGISYYDARRFALYSDNSVGFVGKSGKTYTNPESSITGIRKMAATYSDFTVQKAFVNNTAVSLGNTTHSFTFNGDPQIRIGVESFTGSSSYPFTGKIYAIRVYNRVLTDAEITQNFNYDNTRFSLGL